MGSLSIKSFGDLWLLQLSLCWIPTGINNKMQFSISAFYFFNDID
ncbi:hypothetical protein C427_1197 [Paraglaciecola psychrophila 170]|uniref:Uncharacterized protein n=1 Tax=Paraglaciecola psychrophila 170 TaxID=1129794 RepID=K7A8E3_9ALTE|nr:hypothetical protein C427_1197 [Paraglaciecola psychrophila 170]GAC37033.1 hypothetical protein GPSY_1398 [Paraglaciecola psychrophila 170]